MGDSLLTLFAERVKAPYATTWVEVRDSLSSMPQLRDSDLDPTAQEKIFSDYQQKLTMERADEFAAFLSNLPLDLLGLESDFKGAMQRLAQLPGAQAFDGMPQDTLQQALSTWRVKAQDAAVESCRTWLRSCELLHTCEASESGTPAFQVLLAQLNEADVRFRRLAGRPDEQERLVSERLRQMDEQRAIGRSGIEKDVDE